MADVENPPCGCEITPYEIHRNPRCFEDHTERRKALYEWRKNKLLGRYQ
jgi:hypothetical protein